MNGIWALEPYYLGPWTLRVELRGMARFYGLFGFTFESPPRPKSKRTPPKRKGTNKRLPSFDKRSALVCGRTRQAGRKFVPGGILAHRLNVKLPHAEAVLLLLLLGLRFITITRTISAVIVIKKHRLFLLPACSW